MLPNLTIEFLEYPPDAMSRINRVIAGETFPPPDIEKAISYFREQGATGDIRQQIAEWGISGQGTMAYRCPKVCTELHCDEVAP